MALSLFKKKMIIALVKRGEYLDFGQSIWQNEGI